MMDINKHLNYLFLWKLTKEFTQRDEYSMVQTHHVGL